MKWDQEVFPHMKIIRPQKKKGCVIISRACSLIHEVEWSVGIICKLPNYVGGLN